MVFENWALFVTVCFIASITPGPGILSVINHSIYHGARNSVPIICGILSGLFLLSLMAIMGLGAILETSKQLFEWLQYFGSAYLCYIGIRLIIAKPQNTDLPDQNQSNKKSIKLYLHGISVSMVNPKAIGFFSALFLPFINTKSNFYQQFAILETTLLGCSLLSLFFYSVSAQIISPTIKKYGNAFNKLSGGCFIGLSILFVGLTRNT